MSPAPVEFEWLRLLRLLAPELIVVATALLALTVDLVFVREKSAACRSKVVGGIACLGCGAAIVWIGTMRGAENLGMFSLTQLGLYIKQVMLGLTIFTALVSFNARFTKHVGEYFALLLLAASGLMLLISSENLLMIFVSLELLSISLYAMVAFNKENPASSEAALKYFLFGAMAAAFTVFGISLVYGITGSLELREIAAKLNSQAVEPVLYLALVMTLIGFGFKLAAAPFHLWAPDAYQGAPTQIASFIASCSKVGSFYVLARILAIGFPGQSGSAALGSIATGWMPMLAVIAVASMLIGNIAALMQSSVKRLLAYSAVAHAGYALVAFFGNGPRVASALMFYVITYALTVLGAFAVISLVENGKEERMTDFAGLSRRAPLLSACMGVFLLSLAGIPPLSGFFGKFYVFTAAAAGAENLRLLWLVIVAICASAISLYYYLQVLKQIYVAEAPVKTAPLQTNLVAKAAIVLLAVVVVVLGCAPNLLLDPLAVTLGSSLF